MERVLRASRRVRRPDPASHEGGGELGRREGGRARRHAHPVCAHGAGIGNPLRLGGERGPRRPPLPSPARRRARRECRTPGRQGGAGRGSRNRGHCGGPDAHRGSRPRPRRGASCRRPHGRRLRPLHRAAWAAPGRGAGHDLALHVRLGRAGHGAARVLGRGRDARQRGAPSAHQEGRQSPASAHPCRGLRRSPGVRHRRTFHRASAAGRDLDPAGLLGRRPRPRPRRAGAAGAPRSSRRSPPRRTGRPARARRGTPLP